jgi:ADP-ribose pyrophosphatase
MGDDSRQDRSARVVTHRRLFEGTILDLDVDDVEEPGGVHGRREVVRQRGSVAALPVHEDGRITLVRQYRYAVDAFVWELPAGRKDPGETPEQGARRELEEEVGLQAGALEPIATFWTTPGFSDEVMHLFRATRLQSVPPRPEADERIEASVFTLAEAEAMMRSGEIREGKTLVALLSELRRRPIEEARFKPDPPASGRFSDRPGSRRRRLGVESEAASRS